MSSSDRADLLFPQAWVVRRQVGAVGAGNTSRSLSPRAAEFSGRLRPLRFVVEAWIAECRQLVAGPPFLGAMRLDVEPARRIRVIFLRNSTERASKKSPPPRIVGAIVIESWGFSLSDAEACALLVEKLDRAGACRRQAIEYAPRSLVEV